MIGTQPSQQVRSLTRRPALTASRQWVAAVFIGPSFLLLLILTIYPMFWSLYHAFQRWNLMIAPMPMGFAGLDNFRMAFSSPTFLHSISLTIRFALISVLIQLLLGLAVAVLLYQPLRGAVFVRSMLIMPTAVAPVVAGFIFRYLYDVNGGLIHYLLTLAGFRVPLQGILGSESTALWGVMVTDVWQWTPFVALMILAGLHMIPEETREAAFLDGATPFQNFWYVTLPLLKRVLVALAMIRFMQSYNIFDIIYVQTMGGPGDATRTLAYELFYQGMVYYDIGYASALTWIIAVSSALFVNLFVFLGLRGDE